jgi:hypothetical protein
MKKVAEFKVGSQTSICENYNTQDLMDMFADTVISNSNIVLEEDTYLEDLINPGTGECLASLEVVSDSDGSMYCKAI